MWRIAKPILGNVAGVFRWPIVITRNLSSPVLLAVAAWYAWGELGPVPYELAESCKLVVDRTIPRVVDELCALDTGVRTVTLAPVGFDPSRYVTDALRRQLAYTNVFLVESPGFVDRLRRFLRLRPLEAPSIDASIEESAATCDAVLAARVEQLETRGGEARLSLDVRMVRCSDRALLFDRRYEDPRVEGARASSREAIATLAGSSFAGALVWWLLVALGLPIVSTPFIVNVLAARSDRANAFLLAVFAAVDLVLASALVHAICAAESTVLERSALIGVVFAASFAYLVIVVKWLDRLLRERRVLDGLAD